MFRSLYRTPEGNLRTDLKPEDLQAALTTEGGLLWVDLSGEPPEVCEPLLRETFGFHPLAVEDALQESHVPKVDDWGAYLYAVFQAVAHDGGPGGRLRTLELDVFLGQRYMVTYHEEAMPALDRAWDTCRRADHHLVHGPDHLLYYLTDELVTGYLPVMDELTEDLDELQDQVFARPTNDTLERIFGLKRTILRLQRVIGPQREVLARLARDDYALIDERARVYFRDVYDQFVRLNDLNDGLRDLVAGALETYLSVVNNRMNEIMKTLTLITTLFMPLSFIVGFFGMNFFAPPGVTPAWTGRVSLVLTLAALAVTPLIMYWWARRRGWM